MHYKIAENRASFREELFKLKTELRL